MFQSFQHAAFQGQRWRAAYLPVVFSVLALVTAPAETRGDNWGHWRGVAGNGVAKNAQPPTEWSNEKNVKWKVAVPGRGSGSPVIWEDKVFVVSAVPTGGAAAPAAPQQGRGRGGRGGGVALVELDFNVYCYNRADGKLLWQQTAVSKTPHEGTHPTNGFASASPCTDGKHLYAFFGSRGLYCFTLDGELKWKRDDFGNMNCRAGFGEGSSPALAGDALIVPWDHEGQSYVYSINKLTGETNWKTARDEPTNWGTPLVVEHDGKQQIVLTGQTCARAYDFETGKELWYCAGQTQRPCASPVAIDDMVIVTSGHRGAFLGAFKLGGSGNLEGSENVVWTLNNDTPDIASPVLSEGRLYFYKGKNGILSCYDAKTGKQHFPATRVPGLSGIYASPVAAGGYVFLSDRDGKTVVIKDGEKFEVVATNSLGETIDATPAPVDDQLFIRGEQHLFCIAK